MTQFDTLSAWPPQQRWRQQPYPVPVAVAIIKQDDSYLLIKRKSAPYQGMWALVGGKWDFGEELATAVIREVKEETSLSTRFVALRGLVNERLQDENSAAHFLLLVCEVTAVEGTAHEQNEGSVAWFSRAELDALQSHQRIIPSDYAILIEFATASQTAPLVEVEMIGQDDKATLHRFQRLDA